VIQSWQAESLIGMRLGSCTLERPLGIGGMGAVFRARQERPRRQVAVKVLRPQLASDAQNWPIFMARFQREADATAALDHANIVPIYEFGQEHNIAYLVMPYMPNGSLADLLARRGTLPIEQALNFLDGAAAALDYAHSKGIIHRDVKPSNLLIHPDGRLMLTDFGIARPLDRIDLPPTPSDATDAQLTQAGVAMGTPEFMAPEQIRGAALSAATDIYGLGIVAYTMLTGRTPFSGTDVPTTLARQLNEPPISIRRFRPDVPPGLEQAILWALAKDPNQRPTSASEFAQAARNGAHGLPLTAPNQPTPPNPYATARLPLMRMAPASPLSASPQIPAQAAPPVLVAPFSPPANTVAMPPAAPSASDATSYDARRMGVAPYGQYGAGRAPGAPPPQWPSPASQRRRGGGVILPIVSIIAVVALACVGVLFVQALAHINDNPSGQGSNPSVGAPTATVRPTPTATFSPTPSPTDTPVLTGALSASPSSLDLSCSAPTASIILTNTGNHRVSWQASMSSGGIAIQPKSGRLSAGEHVAIRVTMTLNIAKQSGAITFSPTSANGGQPAVVEYTTSPCTVGG